MNQQYIIKLKYDADLQALEAERVFLRAQIQQAEASLKQNSAKLEELNFLFENYLENLKKPVPNGQPTQPVVETKE